MRRCQVRREVYCEPCCEVRWFFFECAKRNNTTPANILNLEPLSHTQARVKVKVLRCARHHKTEKNVRATRCSVYTPRRPQGNRHFLGVKLFQKICEFTVCDLSICDLSIGDLAIGRLGVHAIENHDVRNVTKFVEMLTRKKVARNKSSNFDSSIPILLAMLRQMVFALFSRSSE